MSSIFHQCLGELHFFIALYSRGASICYEFCRARRLFVSPFGPLVATTIAVSVLTSFRFLFQEEDFFWIWKRESASTKVKTLFSPTSWLRVGPICFFFLSSGRDLGTDMANLRVGPSLFDMHPLSMSLNLVQNKTPVRDTTSSLPIQEQNTLSRLGSISAIPSVTNEFSTIRAFEN